MRRKKDSSAEYQNLGQHNMDACIFLPWHLMREVAVQETALTLSFLGLIVQILLKSIKTDIGNPGAKIGRALKEHKQTNLAQVFWLLILLANLYFVIGYHDEIARALKTVRHPDQVIAQIDKMPTYENLPSWAQPAKRPDSSTRQGSPATPTPVEPISRSPQLTIVPQPTVTPDSGPAQPSAQPEFTPSPTAVTTPDVVETQGQLDEIFYLPPPLKFILSTASQQIIDTDYLIVQNAMILFTNYKDEEQLIEGVTIEIRQQIETITFKVPSFTETGFTVSRFAQAFKKQGLVVSVWIDGKLVSHNLAVDLKSQSKNKLKSDQSAFDFSQIQVGSQITFSFQLPLNY